MSPAPGAGRRLGDSLLATWTVAGALIATVFSAAPLEDAVRAAPWLMGPGLWVATAAGSGALLRAVARWDLSLPVAAVATIVGGGADALVVAAGHPWPGLVTGIGVFCAVVALAGGPVHAARMPGKDPAAGDTKQGMGHGHRPGGDRA